MNDAILDFIRNTDSIVETDYGDFMRRENLYLLQLREALSPLSNETKIAIRKMQDYLQFKPNWDLEATKHQIKSDAHDLMHLVEINPARDVQENTAHHFHP